MVNEVFINHMLHYNILIFLNPNENQTYSIQQRDNYDVKYSEISMIINQ